MVTQPGVGGDRVDGGHRHQLAATRVQHRSDLKARLQPRAEAAAGATRALGDRAQPPVIGRVQMQDPIGLAVADRTQDDRVGPQRAGHRVPRSSVVADPGYIL